jgi:hypothetical protein
MKRLAMAMTIVGCTASIGLQAQAPPDFSGIWTLESYRGNIGAAGAGGASAAGGGGTRAGGAGRSMTVGGARVGGGGNAMSAGGARPAPSEITVRQTGGALTIAYAQGDATRQIVYTLGGAESVNVSGSVTLKTTSRWDGVKLLTEGTQSVATSQGAVTATFKEVRFLEADGTMVIETTRQPEGNQATTSRQVYAKKAG